VHFLLRIKCNDFRSCVLFLVEFIIVWMVGNWSRLLSSYIMKVQQKRFLIEWQCPSMEKGGLWTLQGVKHWWKHHELFLFHAWQWRIYEIKLLCLLSVSCESDLLISLVLILPNIATFISDAKELFLSLSRNFFLFLSWFVEIFHVFP
jgi:hypothetical protein